MKLNQVRRGIQDLRWGFRMWRMWELAGWPTKRRCPQCAGEGTYLTEVQARYQQEVDSDKDAC
jgi:hypothetical protein